MTAVTQAEFARMKGVSRKTVTRWKSERRLVFSGKLIDVAASQIELMRQASHASTGMRAPVTQAADRVTGSAARYADGAEYGNPANLPDMVMDASVAIDSGAVEMAKLLRPHVPLPLAKAVVTAWVKAMRRGYVGGPGLPDGVADSFWPVPPIGFSRWSDHPLFRVETLAAVEWDEIEADYAAGKLNKVTA